MNGGSAVSGWEKAAASDEFEELAWEIAAELARAEGSPVFGPLHDEPADQRARADYRARARIRLGMPCCSRYGDGDHDSAEHGGAAPSEGH